MIRNQNIVALYANQTWLRDCPQSLIFHIQKNVNLAKHRVAYINCEARVDLLSEKAWGSFIRNLIPDVHEIGTQDELKKKIMNQKGVPNKLYLELPG